MKAPILSVCIPTYNRGAIVKGNLEVLSCQVQAFHDGEVELIVSDNCSTDNTSQIVKAFLDKGVPIKYNRNESNLGADGNFLKCMHLASGKYVQLLGDDDYYVEGGLKYLVELLRRNDFGLLNIDVHAVKGYPTVEYTDINDYLKRVNRMFTWMSGNIFRRDIVDKVDSSRYLKSCLLQMPFFLTSAFSYKCNAVTGERIIEMDAGQRNASITGGEHYIFMKVFAYNFLRIMKEFCAYNKAVSESTFPIIKRKMYEDWISSHIRDLLFKKNRELFANWYYTLKCYGFNGYFYESFFRRLKR